MSDECPVSIKRKKVQFCEEQCHDINFTLLSIKIYRALQEYIADRRKISAAAMIALFCIYIVRSTGSIPVYGGMNYN